MNRLLAGAAALFLFPAMSIAQQPRRVADTSFPTSDYSLDREFGTQAERMGTATEDGTSIRRFRSDNAGIVDAVKLLLTAASDNFTSVRVEGSKEADDIFGGANYDGRIVIDGGLLMARASVEHEDGRYSYKLNLPLLRSGGRDAASAQVLGLLKLLPPLIDKDAKAGKPSEYAGILHYDITVESDRPAIRLEQIGSNVAIYVYPKASQLVKR